MAIYGKIPGRSDKSYQTFRRFCCIFISIRKSSNLTKNLQQSRKRYVIILTTEESLWLVFPEKKGRRTDETHFRAVCQHDSPKAGKKEIIAKPSEAGLR